MRALVLVVSASFLLAGCRKAPSPPPAETGKSPSFIFQGFEARASHLGAKLWEAQAARARVYQMGGEAEAEEVTITYYDKGKVVSTAKADEATLNLKTYDLDARGSVVVRGSNGVVLNTPRLHWDNGAQLASSDARVRLQRGGTVLTGRGFRADRQMRDVRILADVSAEASSVKDLRKEAATLERP